MIENLTLRLRTCVGSRPLGVTCERVQKLVDSNYVDLPLLNQNYALNYYGNNSETLIFNDVINK
jgi:hypothetical protein